MIDFIQSHIFIERWSHLFKYSSICVERDSGKVLQQWYHFKLSVKVISSWGFTLMENYLLGNNNSHYYLPGTALSIKYVY